MWLIEVREKLMELEQCPLLPDTSDTAGPLLRITSGEGFSVSLGVDRVIACDFKSDLDDIRVLISDDTTEDLSLDELYRVARDELRPFTSRCRVSLLKSGFEETIEADEDYYVISFKRPLTDWDEAKIAAFLLDCWKTFSRVYAKP